MQRELSFVELDEADAQELARWLAADEWPFHGTRRPELEQARGWIDSGRFFGSESRSFWIGVGAERRAGLLALQELQDLTPVFDLRLRSPFRGRGLGGRVLGWLAGRVFTQEGKHRVEGHTRADNEAMRRLFRAAGWVQEAYHRQAWPAEGRMHDAVTYALLKSDWEAGTRTPVLWDAWS
jgi:RimJ/RimL family protein N-acetyltransferase